VLEVVDVRDEAVKTVDSVKAALADDGIEDDVVLGVLLAGDVDDAWELLNVV